MSVRCFQVDAFSARPFAGNPAAVCLLEKEQDDDWMQSVAVEMNLSETAFLLPAADGYHLRWFTPAREVELCGHATIASAHTLWAEGIVSSETIPFHTKSGVLTCRRVDDWIEADFPATPAAASQPPHGLLDSLGVTDPSFYGQSKFDGLVVVESESTLRQLKPDFRALADIPIRGVIVTCPSEGPKFDFVSRFFAPACAVDEDPVTGSAHCCLTPYWSERLGKKQMIAFQASARGGVVRVSDRGERVLLSGQAVTVLRGELL